jgi:type I restriction enzyme S subunit
VFGPTPFARAAEPRSWKWVPLKFAAAINSHVLPENTDPNFRFRYIDIASVRQDGSIGELPEFRFEDAPSRARRQVAAGDVVVSTVRTYLRAIARVPARDEPLICSTGFATLRARTVEPRYLYWWARSNPFVEEVVARSVGVGYPAISPSDLGRIPTPVPLVEEQQAIADFLDRETARIDAVVRQRMRERDLVRERRGGVIAAAVSGGMDSASIARDVLLGRIPQGRDGWPVRRLKHVAARVVDTEHATAPDYADGHYLIVRTTNVRNGELRLEDAKYTDEASYRAWTKRGVPKAGDILLTREAPAGEACIVPEGVPLCIGQRMVLLCVDSAKLDSRYALYSLYGGPPQEFMKLLSQGSTVEHLNMRDIPNIPLVVPSVEVQRQVADILDQRIQQLDQTVRKLQAQIRLLSEHAQTLISAAVTGGMDIPQEAV